jgi:hypothetical protein
MIRNVTNTVVLTIVFVLVGAIFLSCVSYMRRQADRAKCQNNLKQIWLGALNFESATGRLPAATVRGSTLPPSKRFGWLKEIIPYIEAQSIYLPRPPDYPWDDSDSRFEAIYPAPVFQCPFLANLRPKSTLYPTSYIGITGLGADAAELPLDDPRAGVFGYDRVLSFPGKTEFRISSLIAVMETTDLRESCISGGPATVRGFESDTRPILGEGGQFGELRSDGACCAFLDGSAHFVHSSIDLRVLKDLATLQGSVRADWPEQDR